jgi:hypothetical protein
MPSIREPARRCAIALAALLAAAVAVEDALAGEPRSYPDLCEQAILHGAAAGGVPVEVLHAVALTETGRWHQGRLRPWPWAVNREGRGYWFASRDEALAFARLSLAEGRRSFDLGCFQINYHWHGARFPSLEAMADPMGGAAYAARFLRELYEEFGSWSAAAGAYHSRTPEFARRYRARFEEILAGLDSRLASAPPAAATKAAAADRASARQVRGPRIITIQPPAADETPAGDERAATSARSVIVHRPGEVLDPSDVQIAATTY